MKPKLLMITMLAGLLLCASAFAQKDYTDDLAASQCGACVYEFTDSMTTYEYGHQNTYHTFKFDSDGKSAKPILVAFKVHTVDSIDHNYCTVSLEDMYIDTTSFTMTMIDDDESGQYYYCEIIPSSITSYDEDEIFEIKIRIHGECYDPAESVAIDLLHSTSGSIQIWTSFRSPPTPVPQVRPPQMKRIQPSTSASVRPIGCTPRAATPRVS